MKKLLKIVGLVIGIPIALFLIGALIGELQTPRKTTLVFDNGTAAAVKVRVDGQEVASIPARELWRTESIRWGKHKVEILGTGDKVIESSDVEMAKNIASQRKYIYNIKQSSRYAIYTLGYGAAKVSNPRQPLTPKKFFEVEQGALELGEGFPTTVKVRKGTGGTTLSVLGHQPIHRDRKCCQKLRDSLKS